MMEEQAHLQAEVRDAQIPATLTLANHLYIGTPSQNQQDAVRRRRQWHVSKTHCPAGHPYDDANTMRATQRTGRMRKCKTCHRLRMRESNAKNREHINARQRAYNARKKAERQCA